MIIFLFWKKNSIISFLSFLSFSIMSNSLFGVQSKNILEEIFSKSENFILLIPVAGSAIKSC